MAIPHNVMWISLPDGIHNNYGYQIMHDDPDVMKRFNTACWTLPKDQFRQFWQGGSPGSGSTDWSYFEFWIAQTTENQDMIIETAMRIANELGVRLELGTPS